MDRQGKDSARFNNASISSDSDVYEPASSNNSKQRGALIQWLNGILPDLSLPINASDEELRVFLVDGSILCQILNKLKPGCVTESLDSLHSSQSPLNNVQRFLSAIDKMGLPRFESADLEKGSMKLVLGCLLTLQAHFTLNVGINNESDPSSRLLSPESVGEERQDLRLRRSLYSPITKEPSPAFANRFGQKVHEVFQLRQGSYTDLSSAKISEIMKSNSFETAPTQTLVSAVSRILEESIERKNGEIPNRVACLLRKGLQEIDRRICTQAQHLRMQNNLFKAREEKYQSRIRVLEALATGAAEETQVVTNHLHQIKSEKKKTEEKRKGEDMDVHRLVEQKEQDFEKLVKEKEKDFQMVLHEKEQYFQEMMKEKQLDVQILKKEKEDLDNDMENLRQELEVTKQSCQQLTLKTKAEAGGAQQELEQDFEKLVKEKEKDFQMVLHEKEQYFQEMMKEKQQDVQILKKEKEDLENDMANLRQELEVTKQSCQQLTLKTKAEAGGAQQELEQDFEKLVKEKEKDFQMVLHEKEQYFQEMMREKQQDVQILKKEKEDLENEMANLRQELEVTKQSCQQLTLKTKAEAEGTQQELEGRLKETLGLLTGSRNRVEELEAASKSKLEWWNKKQHIYKIFIEFMLGALRELRFASQSIQQDILRTKKSYSEEFTILGSRIKVLDDAAKSYYTLLAENQKIHNELQELKGNIRVYCRIRPFLPGQKGKQSIVEYIGDNGELIITNPSKPGKEGRRSFKFNKVYGLSATQAEVFSDIKPLVQSVLDGYNVCIFAYGQTGSGKTYTMTGPDGGGEEEWGVNYRALNNLFHVSQSRKGSFTYEISVQMVEIYNEQVRDLLSNDGAQKRLVVSSTMQASGLAVPDASIHTVKSTSGVLELMDAGLNNRAKSSTAMNERSSRSHSVLSIHVRGTEIKSGSSLRGSLHLVDLAGSERVDRSEVTGDRLKEAQHINKSLSALGDVIFALAQKNPHIPYRNSKLTQVLQSSLGGQAKTLMFVQVNPDATSHSESSSTLKFAERVSGVELGAAKSNKDGRDVRELMEQVASLKDTIAQKDEEIEMLHVQKDPTNGANGERGNTPAR